MQSFAWRRLGFIVSAMLTMTRVMLGFVVAWALLVHGLAAAPAWALADASGSRGQGKRPNILIVMTDDQGLGDFSHTGNPVLKTPNLDAFARSAIRFTDFHVSPMCSPTRGQLLTGLAALRNGATSVTAGRTFLRPGLPTLPEAFAKAGYKTGIFGKWHLGDVYPHRPMDKGFQEAAYHLGWGQLGSTPELGWPLIDGRYFHNGVEKRYAGHCTDLWFNLAMDWMKACQERGEPFFCYLPTNAPHAPHVELPKYVEPYEGKGPAGFFGMIAHIDERFGDLERFLQDRGLAKDTILVFMTDNGGTSGVATFNAGLRAGKTTYYEGGHRVPCWIRWPGGALGEPRDIEVPTQNTDLFPTLCELAGVPLPARAPADAPYLGASLVELLKTSPEASLLLAWVDRKMVVQYGQNPAKHDACVAWGRWRLVKGAELYDVRADRGQVKNLAQEQPERVRMMREHYEAWWAGVEKQVGQFVPQSIGAAEQPIVELTSGDWEGVYADNYRLIGQAVVGPTGGHWHIKVERAGEYEFTLRRWPESTKAALGGVYELIEPAPAKPAPKPGAAKQGAKPLAFPTIAQAKLSIAGVDAQVSADAQAPGATLIVTLPAGATKLKAWFADGKGEPLCGAFFVTVRLRQPSQR